MVASVTGFAMRGTYSLSAGDNTSGVEARDRSGNVAPYADEYFPDERAAGAANLESSRKHQAADDACRVHERSKWIARPLAPMILPPGVRPHVPAVVREAQGVVPPGLPGRQRYQRLERGITAHHAIQRHEVG